MQGGRGGSGVAPPTVSGTDLYRATVFTPSFLAVLITRQAISPRLAIRILSKVGRLYREASVQRPSQAGLVLLKARVLSREN